MTVATWNIRAAIGPREPFPPSWWRHVRRDRLESIAAFIARLDADVVLLQEVALGSVDGEPLDQPAELARLTGLTARYAAFHHYTLVEHDTDRPVGACLWGNALLSRLPIASSGGIGLPRAGDGDLVEPEGAVDRVTGAAHPLGGVRYADAPTGAREPRAVVSATVETAGGPVTVLGAHLTHVGSGQRLAQAAFLADLAARTEAPVVVAGDLNAPMDAPALQPLASSLRDAFAATGTPPRDPARISCGPWPLDQVLVRGLRPVSCTVDRSAGELSDHWPVRAVLASG